jgi:chorismate--pyruvate lyase
MCKSACLWHTARVLKQANNKSAAEDPPWRDLETISSGQLPPGSRDWLLDEGSLTERLIAASSGDFRVERLSQSWQQPLLSERRLLGLAGRQRALIREVVLRCHGEPWVYARSVIPASTLTGSLRHLRHLQNQSLGAMIFQQPTLQRGAFQLARLPAQSRYIHPLVREDQPAWARRSRFTVEGKPLSVSEVFLQHFRP